MDDKILEALKFIPADDNDTWVKVGMALKTEGYDYSVFDSWSKSAPDHYNERRNKTRWDSFNGAANPVTGATIIKLGKDYGYNPSFAESLCLNWDDVIEYDGDGPLYEPTITDSPAQQIIKYLKTLFHEDEYVGYVTTDVWQDADGKWMPSKGCYDRTAGELISQLEKYQDDIGAVFGDYKKECGAWIRFNPVDGQGVKNENIKRFTYALVESDDMPIQEQDALYRRFELPIACLVHSGGKSLHAIVRVDAKDAEEYRKRVDFLYTFLENNKLKIDKANRNPSRLSRMPGVTRNGNMQTLIATNIGTKSWNDWMDFVEGMTDELPQFTYLSDAMANPPKLPEELIQGVLRVGHKMLISGSSKAGKSFLLMELCVSLAEGIKWLGLKCKKSKVLYVNLEIDPASCINRFIEIYKALKVTPKHSEDIVIWNLRGRAMPLDKLVPKIVRKIENQGFDAVIIDPIYKVITGDENNASEMGQFCNQFDKICNETGCSAIYSHHHSKGAQGFKKAMDRASGSGVFARDPDAQLDMIQLEANEEFMNAYADNLNSTAWRMESSLREFPNFKPINFWFDYPIHKLDDKGILEKLYAEGDTRSNLNNSSKRNQTPEDRQLPFDNAFDAVGSSDGTATIKDLAEYLGVSERTIKNRVDEFSENYTREKGIVKRVKKD